MSAAVIFHLLCERVSWCRQARVPEPDLVMDSPDQAMSFADAGDANGALRFLYLHNALHISTILQPGDRVLDLGCGPAHQLVQVARLNPDVDFLGVDASAAMLECAQHTVEHAGLTNVELMQADMTRLQRLEPASVDCVISTMTLHHLPDCAALRDAMAEIRRVLKPQGRVYLVDFGRLKLLSTQRFFADDLRQPLQFTTDYFNSLRAAFSVEEMESEVSRLGGELRRHTTALAPFIMVFRSAFQRPLPAQTVLLARDTYLQLPPRQRENFRGFSAWFRSNGYALPCALD
jgi:arsenite methyltransferase